MLSVHEGILGGAGYTGYGSRCTSRRNLAVGMEESEESDLEDFDHIKNDSLDSEETKCIVRHQHFAGGSTLEREPASQATQRLLLGFFSREVDTDHDVMLTRAETDSK
jgi:hypothetical protein